MEISNLKNGAHIHLMGICGTAMASLAGLLKTKGFKVTGSDSNPYPPMSTQIESLGIEILKGYKAENLNPKPDFVIVGNVISRNNPEAIELEKLQIPFTSLPKAMGEFIIQNRQSIVISGTHGKTTTTSLMAWVAESLNKNPGFLIGGIAKNFSKSFQNPTGDYFVIEGDEYDTAFFDKVPKFVHYKPQHVILTSVEFDHADIYKDLQDVKNAFSKLVQLIPKQGHLIYCGMDKNISDILSNEKNKNSNSCTNLFSYGLIENNSIQSEYSYSALIKQTRSDFTDFEVYFNHEKLGSFEISLSGGYNILNATAVVAMAHQLNWDLANVARCFKSFLGVKRRQEILGEPNGILVIEDFAHHPTAVKETIAGIRSKYPGRKLITVFEPRSATSRRKVFQKDYVQAFQKSDDIVLMEAFDTSKIDEGNRFSSAELVQDLNSNNKKANCYSAVENIVQYLKSESKPKDIILIMSNGGFDGIYEKLMKVL